MAERTGATSRPAPEPRAERMPVVAAGPKPDAAASARQGRSPLGASASRQVATVRGRPVRQEDRCHAEHHDQDREPEAEDGPVEGDTEVRVEGSHGAEGGQRGETDGHADRQDGPEHDRAEDADQPVGRRHDGPGPERPEHLAVVRVGAQKAADDLAADQEGGEGGDEPECPEGDRLGPDGPLHQGHGGGVGLASA